MKWYLLKQNKCPNCEEVLHHSFESKNGLGTFIYCYVEGREELCGFIISQKKLKEINERFTN
mgnify:CR=1 FL=1